MYWKLMYCKVVETGSCDVRDQPQNSAAILMPLTRGRRPFSIYGQRRLPSLGIVKMTSTDEVNGL